MTVRELRRFHRTRPFHPFIIRLADGQELSVLHPEFLPFAPKGRFATVFLPDGSFELVDLPLVTGLEVRAQQNGKRRAKRPGKR